MDDETLSDERQIRPRPMPHNRELADDGRAVTDHAATTPTSLACRCDEIVRLIDDGLRAPAAYANSRSPNRPNARTISLRLPMSHTPIRPVPLPPSAARSSPSAVMLQLTQP